MPRPPPARTLLVLCTAAAMLAVSPGVAAAGAGPEAAHPAASRHHTWWQGLPVQVRPLPAEIRLVGAGKAWQLRYFSTSWTGRPTVVSGALTLPAGHRPAAGQW